MPSEINSVESYVVQDTSLSKYPEKSFDLTKIDHSLIRNKLILLIFQRHLIETKQCKN